MNDSNCTSIDTLAVAADILLFTIEDDRLKLLLIERSE